MHLYVVLMVVANGIGSVLISVCVMVGCAYWEGKVSSHPDHLEMELFDADGAILRPQGLRTYPFAIRASRSTVERI